jgi:tetratricopeptide (TPR) repeat protein
MYRTYLFVGATALAACNGPRRIHEAPILVNGDRVAGSDATVGARAAEAELERSRLQESRDSTYAVAVAGCAPAICAALARGEVALGMNEAQVLAATRTTPAAWSTRRAAATTVMVGASFEHAPHDAVGEVAMVQLAPGGVTSYGYREPQGIRVVSAAGDATAVGRARATAGALVEEGDALAAAGDRRAALDRYDRALVLLPDDAGLQYRVATLLDQELRPLEALMRYQRFLHLMDLETITAYGDAYAKLADAIARARERVIVLEKQTR